MRQLVALFWSGNAPSVHLVSFPRQDASCKTAVVLTFGQTNMAPVCAGSAPDRKYGHLESRPETPPRLSRGRFEKPRTVHATPRLPECSLRGRKRRAVPQSRSGPSWRGSRHSSLAPENVRETPMPRTQRASRRTGRRTRKMTLRREVDEEGRGSETRNATCNGREERQMQD